MNKNKIIFADLSQFSPEQTLVKLAKKQNAKDFCIVGHGINLLYGKEVSYMILISETIQEEQAKKVLLTSWQNGPYSKAPMKVFAWIPLNSLKDMVVCDIEKNTDMRLEMLQMALDKISAHKYFIHHTDMDYVKDMFKKMTKQKEEA